MEIREFYFKELDEVRKKSGKEPDDSFKVETIEKMYEEYGANGTYAFCAGNGLIDYFFVTVVAFGKDWDIKSLNTGIEDESNLSLDFDIANAMEIFMNVYTINREDPHFVDSSFSNVKHKRDYLRNMLHVIERDDCEFLLDAYEDCLIKREDFNAISEYMDELFSNSESKFIKHKITKLIDYMEERKDKKLAADACKSAMFYISEDDLTRLFDIVLSKKLEDHLRRLIVADEIKIKIFGPVLEGSFTFPPSNNFIGMYIERVTNNRVRSKSEVMSLWVERVIASEDMKMIDLTYQALYNMLNRKTRKILFYYWNRELCTACGIRNHCWDIPSPKSVEQLELRLKNKRK